MYMQRNSFAVFGFSGAFHISMKTNVIFLFIVAIAVSVLSKLVQYK